MHHQPERAAKIVVACAALHNIAIIDRVPVVNVMNDHAADAYRAVRPAPDQPQDFHQGDAHVDEEDARDEYARINFRNLDNAPAPESEEESEEEDQ